MSDPFTKERQLTDLARIITKYTRVITGDHEVEFRVGSSFQRPVSRLGKKIFELSGRLITPSGLRDLTILYGQVNHQIGHLLYTPPKLGVGLSAQAARCATLLEDIRTDRMIAARWPGMAPYLAANTLSHLNHLSLQKQAHLFTYGRKYIDPEIREAARQSWQWPRCLKKIEEIIDKYRTISDMSNVAEMDSLAVQLSDILGRAGIPIPEPGCQLSGEPPINPNRDQSKDQEQADKFEGQKESDESEQTGDPQPVGDAEGEQTGKAEKLKQAITQGLEDIEQSEDVQREMKNRQRSITNHELAYTMPERIRRLSKPSSYDSAVKHAARRFEEELLLLADQGGAAWERRTSAGRLNVQRAMNGVEDLDEMFDTWNEEGEGHDLEVVSLIDASGSMEFSKATNGQSLAQIAQDCAWILDRGIKSVEGSHTAFTFDFGTQALYLPNERPTQTPLSIEAGGGTIPLDALVQAMGILMSSKRRNKVLLIVTDGEWAGDKAQCEAVIETLAQNGVQTALAYLSNENPVPVEEVRHKCERADVLESATQLPKWGASVVEEAIKKKMRES